MSVSVKKVWYIRYGIPKNKLGYFTEGLRKKNKVEVMTTSIKDSAYLGSPYKSIGTKENVRYRSESQREKKGLSNIAPRVIIVREERLHTHTQIL